MDVSSQEDFLDVISSTELKFSKPFLNSSIGSKDNC